MSKKNNISEKEVYRLWIEYLKRSEKYKTYCKLFREVFKMENQKRKTSAKSAALDKLIKTEVSLKLNELDFDYMQRYYDFFGDIFIGSFDDWWKTHKISKRTLPVIVLNDPNACKVLPFFAKEFKKLQKTKKKHLTPKETLKILTESEFEFIFLAVPMIGGVTMDDISKQIADIRKKWAKEFEVEDFYFRRFNMPVSRVRYDEMKRYLQVYDYWKDGMKIKEIIAKINPNRDAKDADVIRSCRMDLQKAKKIIYNVEAGSFPGEPQFR